MMRSLYSGVSGLKTHQTRMDVIGNNIANVNTVAFKSTGVTFNDIMYQTTSGASGATDNKGGVNAKQIGLGVSTAATKVTITSTGSAQSTGDALDIKLSDANSTNFFIVNNGSQNLFTRAGSFYLDGNGNLAMTSTGYLVQGWQTNADQTAIVKDTVSPLRIMQASNLTSPPEATSDATASGVIDKNDTNVTSEDGYVMSLSFYDNLGYAYTAKFSVKGFATDDKGDDGIDNGIDSNGLNEYTVKLTGIYDSDNENILQTYINGKIDPAATDQDAAKEAAEREALLEIFGVAGQEATEYEVSSSYKYNSGVYTTSDGKYSFNSTTFDGNFAQNGDEYGINFASTTDGDTSTKFVSLKELYGLTTAQATSVYANIGNAAIQGDSLRYVKDAVNYELDFNASTGTFAGIGPDSDNAVNLDVSVLGDQFTNAISVNFTKVLNYDNGKTSTMGLDRGNVDNSSVGAGKKLGALTGVSIDQSGKIFGSYDNGNTVLLGQIAVAQFSNASGLESLGNNCYNTTLNSGDFDGIGVEVTADGGSMNTGQLEMSNVDLSTEFTDMITTQRGFQANSRIITVSDTMLEELTNLKR